MNVNMEYMCMYIIHTYLHTYMYTFLSSVYQESLGAASPQYNGYPSSARSKKKYIHGEEASDPVTGGHLSNFSSKNVFNLYKS